MTITVRAFTNNKAQLLVKKAVFYNDSISPYAVGDIWESEDYIVTYETEE